MHALLLLTGMAAATLGASEARAQHGPPQQTTREAATDIATQPARDIGVMPTRVPPLLAEARNDPYSLRGISSCARVSAAIAELNGVLGPDYSTGAPARVSRRIRVTGGMVAGMIVPFRGIVREVSGAGAAQRQLDASIDAGLARRGFLRGIQAGWRCRR